MECLECEKEWQTERRLVNNYIPVVLHIRHPKSFFKKKRTKIHMKRNNLEEQFLKQGFKAIVLFLEGKDINSKVSMLTISRLITK